MPAGVSWPRYISFWVAAMASMTAGSQMVHQFYKPLKDIDVYVSKEIEKRHLDLTPEEVLAAKEAPFVTSEAQ